MNERTKAAVRKTEGAALREAEAALRRALITLHATAIKDRTTLERLEPYLRDALVQVVQTLEDAEEAE